MSRKHILLTAMMLLLIMAIGALFFWKPVALAYQIGRAEQLFRESYGKSSYARILMSDMDWVVEFGGSCGHEQLQSLVTDAAVSDEGKKRVANLISIIDSGMHIAYLRERSQQPRNWPFSSYDDYVLNLNTDAFRSQSGLGYTSPETSNGPK
jgi:hypothetical protein